jgi:hypothetical protein
VRIDDAMMIAIVLKKTMFPLKKKKRKDCLIHPSFYITIYLRTGY